MHTIWHKLNSHSALYFGCRLAFLVLAYIPMPKGRGFTLDLGKRIVPDGVHRRPVADEQNWHSFHVHPLSVRANSGQICAAHCLISIGLI